MFTYEISSLVMWIRDGSDVTKQPMLAFLLRKLQKNHHISDSRFKKQPLFEMFSKKPPLYG
jgi:hypothetical protein